MLPSGNFQVLEAKDGIEGLNLIRKEKPNLIMLDFLLPKMSGWDVYQEIQAQPELRKIPLIIMAGRKEEVVEKMPEPFQYFEFIEKPFEKTQLMSAIKNTMAKAKLPREENTSVGSSDNESSSQVNNASGQDYSAEIEALHAKIDKMQAEIDSQKKQLAQVFDFVKQKVK